MPRPSLCVYVCARVFSREEQFGLQECVCVNGKERGSGHRPVCVRARLGVEWPSQEQ